jgi:hypothetical protein
LMCLKNSHPSLSPLSLLHPSLTHSLTPFEAEMLEARRKP